MTTTDLRLLARDYANGVIDQDEYREERSRLIESILAGDVTIEPREFIAPVEARIEPDIAADKTTFNLYEETSPAKIKSSGEQPVYYQLATSTRKWIIGAVVLVAICYVAFHSL